MTEDVAETAIDYLFDRAGPAKDVGIVFFGGEPLLNKKVLRSAIEYSQALASRREKRVRYSITTNGTLLDDEVITFIKKYNFGLMVSLDGPPQVQDAQRPTQRGTGSFASASMGIKRLMERRRSVTVRCTVTKMSPKLLDLIRFFREYGFTRIVLGPATNPTRPTDLDCTVETLEDFERQEEEDILPWLLENLTRGIIPAYFPYSILFRDLDNGQESFTFEKRLRCGACHGTTTVGVDGRLYPCHRFVGREDFLIGDVSQGIDTKRVCEFWSNYYDSQHLRCKSCWASGLCRRFCPWAMAGVDGGFHAVHDSYCDLVRRSYERGAWLVWKVQTEYPELYRRLTCCNYLKHAAGSPRETEIG